MRGCQEQTWTLPLKWDRFYSGVKILVLEPGIPELQTRTLWFSDLKQRTSVFHGVLYVKQGFWQSMLCWLFRGLIWDNVHEALCGVSGINWGLINGVCYLFAQQILATILYVRLQPQISFAHLLLSFLLGVLLSSEILHLAYKAYYAFEVLSCYLKLKPFCYSTFKALSIWNASNILKKVKSTFQPQLNWFHSALSPCRAHLPGSRTLCQTRGVVLPLQLTEGWSPTHLLVWEDTGAPIIVLSQAVMFLTLKFLILQWRPYPINWLLPICFL